MRTTPAVILTFLFSLFLVACNSSKNESRYTFDTAAMLANYADNMIIPQYKSFAENTVDLQAAITNYRNKADDESLLTKAQVQWEKTAVNWQQIELYLVGPIAENDFALRQRINVYSEKQKTSSCQIDKTTLALADDAGSVEINALKSNQTGLGALDYLLFNESKDFSCTSVSDKQFKKKWQEIDDIEATRALFAEMVAKDLAMRAESLYQTWQIDGDNFRATFINPANGGEYIQALSDALFFLEKNVKDTKLALPIGLINQGDDAYAYPKLVEYPYSKRSLLMIKTNIEAFKEAFVGGKGFGFSNIIIERGQKSLVDKFNTNIDAALVLIDQMDDVPLYDQADLILQKNSEGLEACTNARTNPDGDSNFPACQLYGLIKRITDDLRTGFVAVVDLDIPKRAQSDND